MEHLGNLWGVLGCDSVWFGTLYQYLRGTDCFHFQDGRMRSLFLRIMDVASYSKVLQPAYQIIGRRT
jgi:hypothetical protein